MRGQTEELSRSSRQQVGGGVFEVGNFQVAMDQDAGEAEICQFYVAVFREEHVVGFYVAMDYAVAVQILQS
ncbi:hypothetical protein GEV33_001204 [Tenebrio molitor]|uniref:Uncharacterized protein n=1 Tax=Tenebrio molitor TaxID=7067 RepID=A0A8J6LK52_TENMO|nr:hypothetical protein GEV33_001204 [Tenebrio molitor]